MTENLNGDVNAVFRSAHKKNRNGANLKLRLAYGRRSNNILSQQVNYVLDRHEKFYGEVVVARLSPDELPDFFLRNECKQFWLSYGLFDAGLPNEHSRRRRKT